MHTPPTASGRGRIRRLTAGLVLAIATTTGAVAQPASASDSCTGSEDCEPKRYDGAWHYATFRASDAVSFADRGICSVPTVSVSFTARYRYDRSTEELEIGYVRWTNRTPGVTLYLDDYEDAAVEGQPSDARLGYNESAYVTGPAGRAGGVAHVPQERDPFFSLYLGIDGDPGMCMAGVTGSLVTAKSAGSIPK